MDTENPVSGLIRLNKYIANSGVCSRREADKLIAKGEISVNGTIITEVGTKVNPSDKITYKGKSLTSEKLQYVLLNKPRDFITTTKDERNRRTVMHLVANACPERIYPIGRLDRQTTGLLLFTNDGQLADKLMHPRNEVEKVYSVALDKPFQKNDFEAMIKGTELDDGLTQVDNIAIVSSDKKEVGIQLHSGKNRIIRRLFENYGYNVVKLDRTIYAGLSKKDLPRGKWRYLSEKEVRNLRHFS